MLSMPSDDEEATADVQMGVPQGLEEVPLVWMPRQQLGQQMWFSGIEVWPAEVAWNWSPPCRTEEALAPPRLRGEDQPAEAGALQEAVDSEAEVWQQISWNL